MFCYNAIFLGGKKFLVKIMTGWFMGKLVGLAVILFLATACSPGGGAVSTGAYRWQAYWPEIGVDRYQAVVFPAEAVAAP